MTRGHIVRFHLGGIEVVDGNDARRQPFDLAEHLTLSLREHAFRHRLANPIEAVETPDRSGADGAL